MREHKTAQFYGSRKNHNQAASRYDWDAARAVTQRLETYALALKQDP